MSWATFEDMCDELPVIVPESLLCFECEEREPEEGCDHCQRCLDNLNEADWLRANEDFYGSAQMTHRERLQHEAESAIGLK